MDKITALRNRQLARFLNHLRKTNQLTPGLEVDVCRAYRYVFDDLEEILKGQTKENQNGKTKKHKTNI